MKLGIQNDADKLQRKMLRKVFCLYSYLNDVSKAVISMASWRVYGDLEGIKQVLSKKKASRLFQQILYQL